MYLSRAKGRKDLINLSIAENRQITDLLLPKINEMRSATPFTDDMIYYQDTSGIESTRASFGRFFTSNFLPPSSLYVFDPDNCVIGAGCNAVLENLIVTLCDPGDVVMIPEPYYATFGFDLGSRAGVGIVGVPTSGSRDGSTSKTPYFPTKDDLQKAYNSSSVKPKILLLTHPHNPLGICYDEDTLRDIVEWARSVGVELISDEIYGGRLVFADVSRFSSLGLLRIFF